MGKAKSDGKQAIQNEATKYEDSKILKRFEVGQTWNLKLCQNNIIFIFTTTIYETQAAVQGQLTTVLLENQKLLDQTLQDAQAKAAKEFNEVGYNA